MANPKLIIEVAGDDRKLKRTLKSADTQTKRFAQRLGDVQAGRGLGGAAGMSTLGKAGLAGGIAVGAGIAVGKVNELTMAASDLNEQITKSQAVFGRSAAAIDSWSDTTATSLGISKRAALEATGNFGNLFTTVGIAGDASADMSKRLVTLAADLASFNDTDPTEALDALRSALIGEAEPMRRFGVLLSEVRVQQQAMADTGKTNVKSLTNQEKAIARYEIILKDTVRAQGDVARTAGSYANQQRKLTAQTEDLHGKLGKKLLPAMTELKRIENDVIRATLNVGDAFGYVNEESGGAIEDILKLATFSPPVALINWLGDTEEKLRSVSDAAAEFAANLSSPFFTDPFAAVKPAATKGTPAFGEPGFKPGKAAGGPVALGPTAEQRNRWFDSDITRRLDKVQDIATIKGQIAALDTIAGLIQERIKVTKDITRRLSLEDQLRSVTRQKRGLGEQLLADAAETKRLADAAAAEAAALAAAKRSARQLLALGQFTPGAANLQKQFDQLSSRGDIGELSKKMKAALKGAGKILDGEFGKIEESSRQAIQELFAAIREELNKGVSGGPLTKTTQLSEKILAGLGLSAADTRTLKARLSHYNSAGTALAGAGASTAVTVPITVTLDGKVVAKTSAKYNQRGSALNPTQRNGPNAGVQVGA